MIREVAKKCRDLNLWAKNEICEKLNTFSLGDDEFLGQMTTIAFDFEDVIDNKIEFYNKYKIQVPFVKWNDKTFFRISFQVYNSKDDIRYLIESLIDFKKLEIFYFLFFFCFQFILFLKII